MNDENKLPQITAAFWVMKICATTLGETAGDLLSMTLNVGYAVSSLILISAFAGSLGAQLSAKRYHPLLFWTVIVTTSTAGTTMSDYMDRTLALGYPLGSLILVTILIAVLLVWRATTGSLSVDHVRTRKAEVFYWTAILFSNTLGTALGDFLSDSSGLGSLLALIVVATYTTRISRVVLFWAAFVLTRPFGATAGDVLTKPIDKGGLALGTAGASAVLGAILLALIVVQTVKQHRAMPAPA
jgi:uncharacterized membrane-anchored protein